MKTTLAAIIGTLFCLNAAVPATVIDSHCEEKDNGSIENVSGVYDEDYLFLGNELNFSGEAQDLIFLGKTLTFSGKTTRGLFAGGKKVLYSGTSENGIMAGGLNVVIDGKVSDNSFIGCKNFQLTENGTVDGDLFVGCAKGSIDGAIKGNLHAGSGELTINSVIDGNVTAYGGRIIIGDRGRINGNLTYAAKEKLSTEELARVSGTVTKDTSHNFDKEKMFPKKLGGALKVLLPLGMFISFVTVGLLLLFLPAFRRLDDPQPEKTFWHTSLWGLIPLLMYPAVVVLCIVFVVTIPFAAVLMFAFVPLFFTAYLVGTMLTGKYIAAKLKWNIRKRHGQFLVGALAGTVVSIIPFVNFLAFIFICALGWGMFVSFLFGRKGVEQEWHPEGRIQEA